MFQRDEFARQFTDMMSEGFIFIDSKGKIQIYNSKAKEIFGITYSQGEGHYADKVKTGDIVIIGNNCLGKDDGNLTLEKLGYIGIQDKNIKLGDALIAIGVVGNQEMKPVYIHDNPENIKDILGINKVYMDQDISVVIDLVKKYINIKVNEKDFKINYIHAIGHMVVIDQYTKKVKFYQAKGYTARREGIADLLSGREYRAKGRDVEDLDVIDRHIFEIHSHRPNIQEFYEVATGKDISYENEYQEINGRPTICTLVPIDKGGKRVGAALKVEDISEIRKAMMERDEALLHLEQIEKQLREEENMSSLFPELLGESPEITQVKKLAYKASKTNSTMILLGESGTGKSLLAKAVHDASKNKEFPFIQVNCASIPETLLESELFGYEGGAFTGARNEGKPGMFELAQGGTIFLDEIGEISSLIQVKLLQVLQNRTFYRVGGSKSITVDVRIIVATNKNLEEEIVKGKFREDLYYRINVFPIWIPPLRERKQDIYSLVDVILPKICAKIGCEEKRISGEAIQILGEYDWPGNVRELENILERGVNLAEGNLILSIHLAINKNNIPTLKSVGPIKSLKDIVLEAERIAIEDALKVHKGNKQKAMKALNIGKTSFYEKIKKHNINSSD